MVGPEWRRLKGFLGAGTSNPFYAIPGMKTGTAALSEQEPNTPLLELDNSARRYGREDERSCRIKFLQRTGTDTAQPGNVNIRERENVVRTLEQEAQSAYVLSFCHPSVVPCKERGPKGGRGSYWPRSSRCYAADGLE